MSDASFASLSPTLLARKGGARPAMRPQHGRAGKVDPADAAAELEDLGWNDMGDNAPTPGNSGARIVRFGSESEATALDAGQVEAEPEPVANPAPSPVRETIERIARKLDENRQDAIEAAIKPAAKLVAKTASSGNRRAAFTLRLDPERHLRLRLASTISGSSAQVLVTQALDAMLAKMPEIETLATQVKRP